MFHGLRLEDVLDVNLLSKTRSISRSRCITSSECPPRSKKLLCTLIGCTPSSFSQIFTSFASTLFLGGTQSSRKAALGSGGGNARRSTLPLGVSGNASMKTIWPGIMYFGSLSATAAANPRLRAPPRMGDKVRDKPRVSRRVLADQGHSRFDARMLRHHGFNFTQLDAEAADLHLVVGPAQEIDVAVRRDTGPDRRCCTGALRVATRRDRE